MPNLPQVGLDAVIANLSSFESGAKAIQRAYDDINHKAGAVEKATGGLGTALTGLGNNLLNIGAIAGGAALAGVTALGAGLATFAVVGINKAIDLDAQMATIAATMNTTKDAVGPLKDLILDLALDPKLTVNTTQAADAIQLLAQNGVTMTEIMDGAAAATVALANATGANFGTAADIASGVMKVFNIEADNMETAIDGITGVVNTSKFTIEDFGQAFAAAGGIAAEIGVSFEDFSAVIAGTATSFNSGSDAGTSFKTFLQRLANPTDENRDLMEKYGISLFDSAGNMRDMRDVVGQLHGVFGDLTQAQKAELAAQLGGADAARTVLALAGMSVEEFDKLSGSVNDSGQAFRAAATRVDSVKGAFEIFRGIIEAVQIQVGDKFLPLLRNITVGFTDLASQAGPTVVDFFGRIADGIGSLITTATNLFTIFQTSGTGGLVSALGLTPATTELIDKIVGSITSLANTIMVTLFPALSGLTGGGVLDAINQAIEFVNLHFEEFKGALIGIGAIAGAGIFAALVAGIVGLVTPITLVIGAAALLGAAWAGNWGGIQEKTFSVWAVVQPVLTQLIDWLSVNVPIALQFLSDAWTNVLLPGIIAFVDFLTGTVFPIVSDLVSGYIDVTATRAQVLADTWAEYLLPAITGVMNYIQTVTIPFFTALGDLLGAVVGVAVKVLAALWQNVLLPALTRVWQYLSSNLSPILTTIGKFLSDNLGPAFTTIADVISEKVIPVSSTFADEILPTLTKGLETVTKWVKDLTGFFNSLTAAVKSFQVPAQLLGQSPPPLANSLMYIADAAGAVTNAMGGFSQATIDALLGIDRNIVSIHGAIGQARDEIEDFLESHMENNKAHQALKTMSKLFHDNADAILNATNRVAKFREILSKVNFGVNAEGQKAIMDAVGIWIHQFDVNIAKMKAAQREMLAEAGRTALEIGNKLNDIAESSIEIFNSQVKSLEDFIASGAASMEFRGQTIDQFQAQVYLNQALQDQVAMQKEILKLKENEQKLGFLEKQLSLVETLTKAGVDVDAILGGMTLGLDASIPNMIAATNKLVQAMIDQVNKDLQISSPSKVMRKAGLFTGEGFAGGILASIPDVMGAMKKAIIGPSMVSGPALGSVSTQRVTNNNFNMNVNSGASPQAVMQQFEIARAMA